MVMRSDRLAQTGVPPPGSPPSSSPAFVRPASSPPGPRSGGGGVVARGASGGIIALGGDDATSPPPPTPTTTSSSSSEYGISTDSLSLSSSPSPSPSPSLSSSGKSYASTSAKVTRRRLPGAGLDGTRFFSSLLETFGAVVSSARSSFVPSASPGDPDPRVGSSRSGGRGKPPPPGEDDSRRCNSKSRCARAGDGTTPAFAAAIGSSSRSNSYGSGPGLAADPPDPPSVLPRELNAPVDAHSGDPIAPPDPPGALCAGVVPAGEDVPAALDAANCSTRACLSFAAPLRSYILDRKPMVARAPRPSRDPRAGASGDSIQTGRNLSRAGGGGSRGGRWVARGRSRIPASNGRASPTTSRPGLSALDGDPAPRVVSRRALSAPTPLPFFFSFHNIVVAFESTRAKPELFGNQTPQPPVWRKLGIRGLD